MKIYLLPGLGFDDRIFRKLNLAAYDTTYLNWIDPLKKESIQDYARRLFEPFAAAAGKTVLVGHSFGGIISQEIAAQRKVDQIILISSIKSRRELPFYFKMIHPVGAHHFFSKALALNTVWFWGGWHDLEHAEHRELFKAMVGKQSNTYLKWALKVLSKWQTPTVPPHTRIFQIHGTKDLTLPFRLIRQPDYVVEGGGHFLVYKNPGLITRLVTQELEKI